MNRYTIAFILTLAAIGGLMFAAQGPAQVDAPRLVSITALPSYDADGKLESLNITAKYTIKYLHPDGKTVKPLVQTITFDLIETGTQTVEVGNPPVLADYDEIAIELVAACLKQYAIEHPGPLPVRKALRTQ